MTTCEDALKVKSQQLLEAHQQIAEYEKILKQVDNKAVVKVGPIEGKIEPTDNWSTVSMLVVMVLSVYAGIRLINKFIK